MSIPALISCAFGLVLLAFYLWMWKGPASFHKALMAFPRNLPVGLVLCSIALAWFGYNVSLVDFGPFSPAKNALFVALPFFLFCMWKYIPDLLAVRGLAYVILLAGNPVLVAVRWHGSFAHYAVALLVYVLMIKFSILIIYPNLWKRGVGWLYASEARRIKSSFAGLLLSAVMIVAGLASM